MKPEALKYLDTSFRQRDARLPQNLPRLGEAVHRLFSILEA